MHDFEIAQRILQVLQIDKLRTTELTGHTVNSNLSVTGTEYHIFD